MKWLYPAAVLAYFAALVALLVATPVLPMQDAPDHVAMLELYRRVRAGDPALAGIFEAHPLSVAYGSFYGFGLLFAHAELALRVYLCVYAGLWVLGLHMLLGAREESRWFVLAATPLVLNGMFYMGFLNLLYVYPLAAIGLALLLREGGRGRAAGLAAISVAVLLAHAIGFALWVAFASGILAASKQGRERITATLPVTATVVLLPLVVGATRSSKLSGALRWVPPGQLGDLAVSHLSPLGGAQGLVLPVVAAHASWFAFVSMRRTPPDRTTKVLLGAAVVALLAVVAGPFAFGSLTFLNVRIVPFFYLAALAVLGRLGSRRPAERVAVAAWGAVLLGAAAVSFVQFSREAAPLLEMGEPGPPRTLLPLVFTRIPPGLRGIDANLRLAGVLTHRNGWVTPYVSTLGAGEMPLSFRDPVAAPDEYEPWAVTEEEVRRFDFVLVYAIPEDPVGSARLERLAPLLARLKVVEERAHWRLYRGR